jgi:hypothetical protein
MTAREMEALAMTIVHLDDSETPELDQRLAALAGGALYYIRIKSINGLVDLLSKDAPEAFLLISDIRLGVYNIVTEFFAWIDEPEYKEIQPVLDSRMKRFILYSGDYPNKKKSELDFRIRKRFSTKFLGGFNRENIDLICDAVSRVPGTGVSAPKKQPSAKPKKGLQ